MNDLLLKMGVAGLLSGVIAVAIVPSVRTLAVRFGAVREPRARDVHQTVMPMWGGVALFAAFMLTMLAMRLWTGQELTVAVGKGQHPILGIILCLRATRGRSRRNARRPGRRHDTFPEMADGLALLAAGLH